MANGSSTAPIIPNDENDIVDYRQLLGQNLIRPTSLEIWIMKADGSDKKQITNLGAASFGPAFTADGKRIIFSSNYDPASACHRRRGAISSCG